MFKAPPCQRTTTALGNRGKKGSSQFVKSLGTVFVGNRLRFQRLCKLGTMLKHHLNKNHRICYPGVKKSNHLFKNNATFLHLVIHFADVFATHFCTCSKNPTTTTTTTTTTTIRPIFFRVSRNTGGQPCQSISLSVFENRHLNSGINMDI